MTTPTLFNLEAEKALIGALLINPAAADTINLEPSDLYVDRHRRILSAIRSLRARDIEPDIVTLADLFDRDGSLADIGGVAYMTELMTDTPWSTSIESYAVVVRDYARRRLVMQTANGLAAAALNLEERIDDRIANAMDALTKAGENQKGARPMAEWVTELREDVRIRMDNPAEIWGIPTGFTDIDRLIGGMHTGEVFYLAGEPGVGKSKLMLQMALNMAKAGVPGALLSLEMSGQAMTRRAVSALGKVPTRMLKSGIFGTPYDIDNYEAGAAAAESLPLYMSDDASLTPTGLRAELARLKSAHGIQWFALDYLLLLNGYENQQRDDERSAKLSIAIKRIARDLNLAALTVNSVTKDGMDSSLPSSKQLRGSGQVIHDADLIAFLIKNAQAPAFVTLVFTKTRDVESGSRSIDLYQHQDYPAFGPAQQQTYSLNGRDK